MARSAPKPPTPVPSLSSRRAYGDTRWTDLIGGIAISVMLVGSVLAILLFARVGALRGDTFRLHVVVGEARDITDGTDVWLAGQRVGEVERISFQPISSDTSERVVLVLEILEERRNLIRRNSLFQIRPGGNLIGAPVVYAAAGPPDSPMVQDGDTLRGLDQSDREAVTAGIGRAARAIPQVIQDVKEINQYLADASGTFGALLQDETRVEMMTLVRRFGMPAPDAGVQQEVAVLRGRVDRAIARSDSLRTALASQQGTIGRLRGDSALLREVQSVRDEISIVRALIAQGSGTAAQLAGDGEMQARLGELEAELGKLLADVKSNPMRYVNF